MSVDNISVSYHPNSPNVISIHQDCLNVASVGNNSETLETNRTSCCERVANAFRRAALWLRNVFCCCCKTSDDAPTNEDELQGVDNLGRDSEPVANDGDNLSLTSVASDDGFEDPDWKNRITELNASLGSVLEELDALTKIIGCLLTELSQVEDELKRLEDSQDDQLTDLNKIKRLVKRKSEIQQGLNEHEERRSFLGREQIYLGGQLNMLKQKFNLK